MVLRGKKMKGSTKFVIGVVALLAIFLIGFQFTGNATAGGGVYDEFAKCVTDSGATMYGAYWCPHCTNQKEMFGKSVGFIDYVECDPRGDGAEPARCEAAGISGYPTWVFADGTKKAGEVPLPELALRTGCSLPV
jgi:hypothetical protein